MDRWVEEVDDSLRPAHYRVDGAWMPLELRAESYRDPRGQPMAEDTLRFTHRGPLQRAGGAWYSLRWTALESGAETGAFHRAAHARTAREWLDAMAAYRSPPQNMLVADRAGRSPCAAPDAFGSRRRRQGRSPAGRALAGGGLDGRLAGRGVSPERGAGAGLPGLGESGAPGSAHQGRYLGANWPSPWRALRINALLRADSAVTPATMRQWQTDPASARADYSVPYFLRAAATRPTDTALSHAARLLEGWDRRYERENEGAVLFESAMAAATFGLWDELRGTVRPGGGAFLALLDDPANPWWDLRATRTVERRDDVLADALAEGYQTTVRAHGPPEFGGWRWSTVHRIDIWHLLRLPGLSRLNIDVTGGPSTLNPSSTTGGSEGASWRMVVELGAELRGWGIYPGGQSGNPASRHYDDRIEGWKTGALDELRFPRAPADVRASSRLMLRPTP